MPGVVFVFVFAVDIEGIGSQDIGSEHMGSQDMGSEHMDD
jgi:hypothetical protein